jgi:hypothetical protein
MRNPTTPHIAGTPAAGGRFVGMRRRVVRAATGTSCATSAVLPLTRTGALLVLRSSFRHGGAGPRPVLGACAQAALGGAPAAGTPECLHDTNLDQLVDLRQV